MGRSRVRFGPFTLDTRMRVPIRGTTTSTADHPEGDGGSLVFTPSQPLSSSPSTNYAAPVVSGNEVTNRTSVSTRTKSVTGGAIAASLTLSLSRRVLGNNGSTLTLTNAGGTTTQITTNSALAPTASTATNIGTNSDNLYDVIAGMYRTLTLAKTAGAPNNLDMQVAEAGRSAVILTQNSTGEAGNKAVTWATSYTPTTANDIFVVNTESDASAFAQFRAKSWINGANATTLTLTNTDTTQTTLTTDNTIAPGASTATNIGTLGANTDALATQALHRSLTLAQAAGSPANLKMSISPTTYTVGGTDISLTQNVPGAAGNTAIVVPAGFTILAPFDGTAATAVFSATSQIEGDNASIVRLTNYDTTQTDLTTDNTIAPGASTATNIGTLGANTTTLAMQALHRSLTLAQAAGSPANLKMSISPVVYNNELEITLTQNRALAAGNTAITVPVENFVIAQNKTATASVASLFGLATLNNQNATTLTLVNTDTTSYSFTTDNTLAPSASTATNIGTLGANTPELATQAIWTALKEALSVAGNLSMRLSPQSWSTPLPSLTLTQTVPGVAGNTLITVPTGVSMGSGDGVNGNFAGGVNAAAAAFTGGTDPPASSFSRGSTMPAQKFSGGTDPDIDVFMDGQPISGVATVSMPDGTYQSDVIELHTSLLAFHRFTISAVEADNGASTAPANMATITVYGLFGSNYKDQDSRNQPTPFSGPPYVQGGFQQVTLGTLTRAAPVFAWDDRMKTTTTVGTDTSESPLPFITGIRLSFAPAATGVIRVYIDAERDF